jgi:hypothetical protein
LDQTSRDPTKNDGFQYGLVIVDVFTRRVFAWPLRHKVPEETISALKIATRRLGGKPHSIETDVGGEFGGAFDKFLESEGVLHIVRDVRHINALGVVESAISRIRRALRAELLETGRQSWVDAMVSAVEALNRRPLDYLMGERPVDTDAPDLNFHLGRRAGEAMLEQTGRFLRLEDRLRAAGKYRVLLRRPERRKSEQPIWSAKVYELSRVEDGFAVSTDGRRERVQFCLPVGGEGARTVEVPAALTAGDKLRDAARREAFRAFVEALRGRLEGGPLSLQHAGEFLAKIPGYVATMDREKLRKQGVRAVLALFPQELEVEGGLVRLRVA